MGSPYHLDLRKRVMKAIHAGMAKTKASEVFNICRQTIYSWIALEKERGHLEPKSDYQNGHGHGISDLDSFKKYVNNHPDQTQEEMAEKFSVGSSTIGRTLQKIRYTRKKRVTRTQSETKKKGVNLKKK